MAKIAKVATRLVNPLYLSILRSPLHQLLSRWLVGFTFSGRRTGRPYRLPVGFARVGDHLLVATDAKWRHNFDEDHPAAIWLKGKRRTGIACVVDDAERQVDGWAELLARRPVLGKMASIPLAPNGRPVLGDILNARQRGWYLVEFRLGAERQRLDLEGRNALVTGATSGIGREVALALAVRGATVIAVGRDATRGGELTTRERISFVQADLSRQDDVRLAADAVRSRFERLDIFVQSAGGHILDKSVTTDGIEANWATNYLSKFLLTELLRPLLAASESGRVVIVGSPVVDPARFLRLGHVRDRPRFPVLALVNSGLATAVWTMELQRRFTGTGATVANLDPQLVSTGVSRSWPWPARAADRLFQAIAGVPASEGAEPAIWLATTSKLPALFFRGREPARVPESVADRALAARLWECSVEMTK